MTTRAEIDALGISFDGPALAVRGVSRRYGATFAVRDLGLVVRPGEIHGLLGPNGAGKTTLLRMLLGLARPDQGEIRLLGGGAGTASGPAQGGVAGFADAPRFYPYLSGRRNLRLLAALDGDAGAGDRVREVLEQVGLTRAADARVGGYSAGMTQRLGFASALLRAPRLLLLDEPTSSLDPAAARDLRENVRRLAREGAAILLSSHDMGEVEELCSSLTIVHASRVVFDGTLDQLREQAPAAVHALATSDDEGARSLAASQDGVEITVSEDGAGLEVAASEAQLDAYVIALGRAGIAVRSLESRDRSLESLFLRLTREPAAGPEDATTAPGPKSDARPLHDGPTTLRASGVRAVFLVELAKLRAQVQVWATLAVCLLGPFAFASALQLQSAVPEDTLFGRWAKASGYAVPLVVLGFAAAWALPVLTSVVAGDVFASEDRLGTWPTLLTRSRTRRELFAGKTLAALAFTLLAVTALALGAVAAGVLVVGTQPLLGLSGTLFSSPQALVLVFFAWASVLPPAFAFTGLALLMSVATRSSAAGVGLPVLAAFAMQLYAFVNGPEVLRRALPTTAFGAWHGLFTEPAFRGPLLEGAAVSVAYLAVFVSAAYLLFQRRDMSA